MRSLRGSVLLSVWTVGTLTVTFLLSLGFPQVFQEIPSYAIEDLTMRILKGGSPIGFKLAYFGTLLLVAGQFYTLRKAMRRVPRIGIGSRSAWLRGHCCLDIAGTILLMIHSGFPLSFRYANPFPYIKPTWGIVGLAGVQGFAAWVVLAVLISGLLGEQLRRNPLRLHLIKPWLKIHIVLTCLLFVFGIIHLFIVLWFKYVSAG